MIDLVIPLLTDKKRNHIDLKYALRSLEENLKKELNLIIIGERLPNWMHNATLIKSIDHPKMEYKERNIFNKIKLYCEQENASDSFIFSNDDIYLLNTFKELPFFYKNDLSEAVKKASGGYRISMKHTVHHLQSIGKETLNFDIHFPIEYNRNDFLCTFVNIDWSRNWGYVIKSMYCNTLAIEGEQAKDLKIANEKKFNSIEEIERLLDGRCFFSTANHVLKDELFLKFMEQTFPNKSKWEK